MSLYDDYLKEKKKKKSLYEEYKTERGIVDIQEVISDKDIDEDNSKWFKSGAFKDGYQAGDLTKTVASTVGDIGSGFTKGIMNIGENIGDLIQYGTAGIADWIGNDEKADELRKKAQFDSVGSVFEPMTDVMDKNSILGDKSDNIVEGLGYVAGITAVSVLSGGAGTALGASGTSAATIGSTITTFTSAMGSGITEAYQNGATDKEATIYGAISGAGEALSELLFGGLGKISGAAGLSKGIGELDDMIIGGLTKKIKNKMVKTILQSGLKAGGEGLEEIISGLISAAGKKITYMDEKKYLEIVKDENLSEQFWMGALTSAIAQGPSTLKSVKSKTDYISGRTENEQKVYDNLLETKTNEAKVQTAINNTIESNRKVLEEAYGRKLSQEELNTIKETVTDTYNAGKLNTDNIKLSNKKQVEIEESIERDFEDGNISIETIRNILGENQDLSKDRGLQRSLYENEQKSNSFQFEKTDNEKINMLLQSATDSGLNNTSKTKRRVEIISKLVQDTDRQYKFVNSEQLKELGYNENANGLINKETGEILINAQSNKEIQAVVGHETTHLFDSKVKGEYTQEYKDLQSAVVDYLKAKGTYETKINEIMDVYNKAGINLSTEEVMEEVTADTIGDNLFGENSEEFIRQLSTKNRNVFQKIYDYIKKVIKNIKGYNSEEQKTLNNLKEQFDKVYKTINIETFSDTKYSIGGERAIENIQKSDYYKKAVENLELAKKLKKEGKTNAALIKATGWYQDIAGDWKFEFSDKDMELRKLNFAINKEYKLSEILNHDTLFYFYPDLANYTVIFDNKANSSYSEKYKTIYLSNEKLDNLTDLKGTLIHEIQHAVQHMENHAHGTSAKLGLMRYYNTLGEIEAADTKQRYLNNIEGKRNAILPESAKINSTHTKVKNGNVLVKIANGVYNFFHGGEKNVYKDKSFLEKNIKKNRPLVVERGRIDNTKYSISQDNQGRQLSKEQQEYFNNSKVVDDSGNLLVMYHSTDAEFNTFTYEHLGKTGLAYGKGFYFTDSEKAKNAYGKNTITAYLDIKKPMEIGKRTMTENDYRKLVEVINDETNGQIEADYGSLDMAFQDYQYGGDDIDLINGLKNVSGLNEETFYNILRNTLGYDGIKANNQTNGQDGNYWIAFNSNQIKNVDNTNPTENEDIRYSMTQGETNQDWLKIEDNLIDKNDLIEYNTIESEVGNNGENREQIRTEDIGLQERENEKLDETVSPYFERIKELTRNVKKGIAGEREKLNQLVGENLEGLPVSKTKMQKFVRELANNRIMTQDDILTFLESNNLYKEKSVDEYIKEVRKNVNSYTFNLSDRIKSELKYKYGRIPRNIRLSKNGLAIDQAYQELSNKYPDIFSDKIINESEQAEEIIEFMRNVDPVSFNETEIYTKEELKELSEQIYGYKQYFDESKDFYGQYFLDEKRKIKDLSPENITEKNTPKKLTRKMVREQILEEMNITSEDLSAGNDIGSINYQLTDPIRVNEKVFGAKIGQKINDLTINRTKHNTAEKTRWLNQERDEIKALGIKPRSKESAAVQKYAEKQEVLEDNTIKKYDDIELAREFPNVKTQDKIKHAAEILRTKYDNYIDQINEVITALGYDEIHKRNDYMRHFQELGDVFSKTGVPFNLNDMKAEDLPTDINGLTEFNKPGKNWFASTQQRYGLKTTYDAITGIDGYLEGAGNLIFHTQDIQNYRALTSLIRDTYGQKKGFDNLEGLDAKELNQRIDDIQNNKLSRYVAWLDEQANSLAGKKGAIDRGVERFLGRRGYTFFNTIKQQVGSNMTGFNVRSSLTNLISSTIAAAKTNKIALAKGTISTINNMFRNDGYIDRSDFLTSRFGSDSLSQKFWGKVSNAGQIFMTGTDYFTANIINRSKYFEGIQKGMTEEEAIKYADDFSSRVMGDRSQGATAEAFNSKTLGLFTQFQLEVNNQWQYMVHDSKIDFEKNSETSNGLKAGATMLFQLGQIAAYSYFFNELFESLTGSRAAFDPIEIIKKLFGLDDDDEEKSFDERLSEAGAMLVDNIPFGNIITGGGRIPISEAFTGVSTLGKKLTNQTDKYGNKITWEDVGKDLTEALPYWLLPTGYGQAKKTIKGMSLYDESNPVSGSYTDAGNLRYTVDDDIGSKIKAGIFGAWANPYAQDYIDSGYKTINKNNIEEMIGLDMNSTEYRDYRQGLTDAGDTTDENGYKEYRDDSGNTYWYNSEEDSFYDNNYNKTTLDENDLTKVSNMEEKLNYIDSLDLTPEQKNIAANGINKNSNKTIDMEDYSRMGSYDEYKFSRDYPSKYAVITQIDSYENYNRYKEAIADIKKEYSNENGYKTEDRKAKVQQYIENLNLNAYQKMMLEKMAGGYSIKNYRNNIYEYLETTELTDSEKYTIWEELFN